MLLLIGASAFTFALRRDDVTAAAPTAAPSAGSGSVPASAGSGSVPASAASGSAPASAAPPRADAAPAGASLAALANKVAVLPCENQSPDPADAYFASGLHQDIIWQLDKLRNLNPIPRITVLRYTDTSLPVAAIAAELSVRALLDCTIRYADNRVRITAELVDRRDCKHSGKATTSRVSPTSRTSLRVRQTSR